MTRNLTDDLTGDLATLQGEFARTLSGLGIEATQTAPAADKWTVQQIVEHLVLTYSASTMAVQSRLDKGAPTEARATVRQRLLQLALRMSGRIPPGRKAPAMVDPRGDLPAQTGDELAARTRAELARLGRALNEAERRFGRGRSVNHLILGPMTPAGWRAFHLIHGRHHLAQVRAIGMRPNGAG